MKAKKIFFIYVIVLLQLTLKAQTTHTVTLPSTGTNTLNVTCVVGDIILFKSTAQPLAIKIFRNPTPNYTLTPTGTSTSYTVTATDTSYSSIVSLSPVTTCVGKIILSSTTNVANISYENHHPLLYPNPATHSINLTDFALGSKIELVDILGNIINEYKMFSKYLDIDISSLQPGIYFIRSQTGSYKFVKS